MAIPFLNLPQIQIRDPGLDTAPLVGALRNYQAGSDAAQKFSNQQSIGQTAAGGDLKAAARQAMGLGELDIGRQYQAEARVDEQTVKKRLASAAQAVELEQDPGRRNAMWQRTLKMIPGGAANLSPEEMDPMTGPKLLMAEAGIVVDPLERQAKEGALKLQQAQIGKLNREAAQGGNEYGKAGTIVQAQDGAFHSVQYGARGEPKVTPLQIGGQALAPSKGVDVVGDQMYNKATGQPVRNVAPNISGAEQAKVVGRETGERQMAAPKAFAAIEAADAKTELVTKTIAEARQLVSPYTTGPGALLNGLPGTASRDLAAKLDTLKANAGFNELQTMRDNSPTGGALGAVAVQELQMLQSTIASLEQSQTTRQLSQALSNYEKFVAESKVRRRRAYEATFSQVGAPQQPNQSRTTPQQTQGIPPGEYVWDGTKLVPKGR